MRLVQDFTKDFEAFIAEEKPFAFVRFHDGEYHILNGLRYAAASKWTSNGKDVWFKDELAEVLQANIEGFYLGISPPCCAPQSAEYYRRFVAKDKMTYATLFQFQNYRRISQLRKKFKNAVIIGSGRADIRVPANGVTQEWDLDAVVNEMMLIDRPFFVAAGPCANIIIHRYWTRQEPEKRQSALDVGAVFDPEIHKQSTRPYHKPGKVQYHICKWNEWQPFRKLEVQTEKTNQPQIDIPSVVVGRKVLPEDRYKSRFGPRLKTRSK